jgi:murein DD-endopeptidase MepM/ murein hydrolase activator NlpD
MTALLRVMRLVRVSAALVATAALALPLTLAPPDARASPVVEPASPPYLHPPHSTRADDAVPATKTRRFWVKDKHSYRSNWYAGQHRKMIAFGCTKAPYYDPSPLCPGRQGFHHGLDIAMRCGTGLFAGLRGRVVRPGSPGSLGSAYGAYAFRLRNHRLELDFVIGHVKQVYVEPGDHVSRGDLIARASDQGAPDGCHLHFEARPRGTSYSSAVKPNHYLHLRRVPGS